jgi:hypothetical protein
VRGAGAPMARGMEVRGDAAARDIVAIVLPRGSRFWISQFGLEDKEMNR